MRTYYLQVPRQLLLSLWVAMEDTHVLRSRASLVRIFASALSVADRGSLTYCPSSGHRDANMFTMVHSDWELIPTIPLPWYFYNIGRLDQLIDNFDCCQ